MLGLLIILALAAAPARANTAEDGSTLIVEPPWKMGPPGNCPAGTKPLHGYRRGGLEADVCGLGAKPRGRAKKLALEQLHALRGRDKAFEGASDSQLHERKLQKFSIFYYSVSVPPGFVNKDQTTQAGYLYGLFDRGDGVYYVITVVKPVTSDASQLKADLNVFDEQSMIALDGLNLLEWPEKKKKRPAEDEEE